MQSNWFQHLLNDAHPLRFINGVWVDEVIASRNTNWSFSQEWKEHRENDQQTTWVWNVQQRLEQFFIETKTNAGFIRGLTILDAGCGNGQLTKAIAACGANLVGIDIHAHLPASEENCVFVQSSFDDPPFKKESFDIIIANGSIHHTASTKRSFESLASLLKENGRLYVWVYRKPSSVKGKLLLGIVDFLRFFISKSPAAIQRLSVQLITQFTYWLSRIRKGENSRRSKEEILINNYDTFTPRYRHYHDPVELAEWFYACGFEEPVLSHWDNKYGFGMMAIKNKSRQPAAGLNYGKNQ